MIPFEQDFEELQGRVRLKRTGSKELTRAATRDLDRSRALRTTEEDSESGAREQQHSVGGTFHHH